ncbi:MAG: DUF4982 domain-containing protein [Phycisphaerae bacterium]|nr:DUF4982 domain-containing protein [Phycisphaerae bacterium]
MKLLLRFLLLVVCFTVLSGCSAKPLEPTDGWKFSLSDPQRAMDPGFDDSRWEMVDVPHDWSIQGPYDKENPSGGQGGYLPTGVGWYRKNVQIETVDPDSQYLIMFDGVFMNSTVWVNGAKVGGRPYGYISFYFDITDHLKSGVNNIAVRVDNEKAPNARWYAGCGIYGDVRLIVKNKISFDQWGIFVATPEIGDKNPAPDITDEQATVAVEAAINNGSGQDQDAVVKFTILGDLNQKVGGGLHKVRLPAGEQSIVKQDLFVSNPPLWSPDSPYLYTLVSEVVVDGEVKHTEKTRFGIRSLRFDADEGFFLNGVHTKLKGVCEHSDGGLVGAAIPEKVLRRRLQILKDMGCNAIRVSHNPRRPLFYDLCDEMGIMVMDEIFDGWGPKISFDYGKMHFKEWWKTDVRDWVKRDRNHPSVIMYSMGNETGIYDKYGISDEVKKYDTTRPTTGGSLLYGVDIPGFNAPGANPGVLKKFRSENPDKPVVLSEVPHTLQTRGFYRTMTWWRNDKNLKNYFPPYNDKQIFFDGNQRYNSSYDNAGVRITARTSWKRTKETPWILGEFRWTGFDYLGEASFGGGKWPARIWNFGIIDLCGFPKDHYYFYQSQWTEKPMVHILPHWTHPGMEGVEIPVVAYSNCEEVELFLNGESLGKKPPRELLDFVWKVPYVPGTLKAVGYKGGKAVAEKVFKTASNPTTIELTADNVDMKAGVKDISHLTATIKDADGNFVPWACNRIDYKIEGPVKLLGFDNGDPMDVTSHRETYRKTFNGLSLGIFEATSGLGPIEVTAAGILGRTKFENSTKIAIDVSRIALRGELPDAAFDITYSVTPSILVIRSKYVEYTGPFELTESATVKVKIKKNGKEFMVIESDFVKGPIEKVTDERFENPEPQIQKTIMGPAAKQVVGEWFIYKEVPGEGTNRIKLEVDGNRKFVFTETGSVFTVADGEKSLFGYWRYDYPENPKDSSDVGDGLLFMFVTDGLFELKLDSPKAERMVMKSMWRNMQLMRKE